MAELIIVKEDREYYCLFDEADRELIEKYSWSLHSEGYAQTTTNGKTILMHRLLMGIEDQSGIEIDHVFHNRLDNRRSRLRICSHSENMRNARKMKHTAHSKYKGIYLDDGRWHVQITLNKKVRNLGRFSISNEIMAAKCYDQKALEIFKDFACINFESSREARQLTFQWI